MPNTRQQVHIDKPLTMMALAYIQMAQDFIASRLAPIIRVDKASDLYWIYNKADWARDDMQPRAIGTKASSSDYQLSTDRYLCLEYAHRHAVYDQMRGQADDGIDLDRNATEFVTRKALLKYERVLTQKVFTTGVWNGGTDITGVSGTPSTNQVKQWNDPTSTPIADIDAQKEAILLATGYIPNTLTVPFNVFNKLKEHPAILERIKYNGGPTNPAVVTEAALAQVFNVQNFLVAKSVIETAKPGAASARAFTLSKAALLCYINPGKPYKEVPSALYTFADTNVSQGLGAEAAIRTYREEDIRAEWHEAEMSLDVKITGSDLGVFFTSIIA